MTMQAGKLDKFRALSWPDRRTLLAALLWLPVFRAGLRVLGLRRMQAWIQHKPPGAVRTASPADAKRLGALVNRAARQGFFRDSCLTRSLLLCWLLRRRGVMPNLRIGVRLVNGALDAHAWVEQDGMPINDRPDIASDYPPFHGDLATGNFNSP